MMVVKAKVRRDGDLAEIPMDQLVPGDIVNIEAGDLVPADARILSAATLEIDESALTGESVPTPKQVDAVAADAALGDRVDMAFMNCQVTRGAGTILVDDHRAWRPRSATSAACSRPPSVEKTPADQAARRADEPDPGHRRHRAGRSRSGSGLYRNVQLQELFLSAVAFAVAAIPTALPAVVTAILSKGSQMLADAGAIMKRLRSVETLGSTSALNSDKTGTLTLNQMTAVQMAIVGRRYSITGDGYSTTGQITHAGGQPDVPLEQYLLPMALCADAEVRDGALVGDPTEGALVVLAAKGGVDPTLTRERYPRVATLPFDAAYKMMATFHAMTGRRAARTSIRGYVKGAPDQLLARAVERPRPGRHGGPGRPDPRRLPRRERAPRHAGPAGHGDRPEGLRPGDVRPERRPAAAARRADAARDRRHRRPAAAGREGRHRQGACGRHPGPDDHRRPRGHGRGDRPPARASRAGPSPAPTSAR